MNGQVLPHCLLVLSVGELGLVPIVQVTSPAQIVVVTHFVNVVIVVVVMLVTLFLRDGEPKLGS